MRKSVLVTLADRHFLDQAKQLFASAYLAGGWDGDYLLLAHDLTDEETRPFRDRGIMVENLPDFSSALPTESGQGESVWPGVVWSKFYLMNEKFKDWEQVVFLDSDIIVKASLVDLSQVQGLVAIADFFPNLKSRFTVRLKGSYRKLRGPAFNSGVLAYRTDIIKPDSFFCLLELAQTYASVAYGDEAIFNLFFYRRWQSLPFVYNVPVPYLIKYCRWPKEKINGVILHFIDRDEVVKPWHPDNYFYSLWLENLNKFRSIDFVVAPSPALVLAPEAISALLRQRRWRRLIYFHPRFDRQVGQVGLWLKRISPLRYYQLRKIKNALPFFGDRAGA